ncbi:hypothetical protein KC19_12G104500 [Ceratodon purpureus]|uniref:AB hydrolase-1 domain-containing protein n=1 Tax=Ceratodon purpureus TaxID=3225 RepID=A0A8T0G5P8_CERPU|nr:hypothetical protein KC19_12G104500 [Ceratodon purpureus]
MDTRVEGSTTALVWRNREGEEVRARLLDVLNSRRQLPVVPPEIFPAEHHNRPYLQQEASFVNPQVLALCPNAEGSCRQNTEELEEEDLVLRVEAGEQGNIPFLVIRPKLQNSTKVVLRRPVVICLHSTGNSKETMRPFMRAYASLGYVAVGMDARNHGDRGRSPHAYANALVAAWKTGQEMPFLFDTVWDLIKLIDYLTGRPDIDPQRIGMMGISLGGMHTWFAAAADPRIAAAVSLIGVQSFGWAIAHDQWHARVASIPQPFEAAAQDLGKNEVDTDTVAAVWQRLAPGLMDFLDSPHTVPAIAPRPLLVHNGEDDPRCPIEGLAEVVFRTVERYKEAGALEHFKFLAEEGLGHTVTAAMGDEAITWFNKHLRPETTV